MCLVSAQLKQKAKNKTKTSQWNPRKNKKQKTLKGKKQVQDKDSTSKPFGEFSKRKKKNQSFPKQLILYIKIVSNSQYFFFLMLTWRPFAPLPAVETKAVWPNSFGIHLTFERRINKWEQTMYTFTLQS